MTVFSIAMIASASTSAIATIAIAIFSYQLYRVNKRLTWFTGATETHSEIQLAIAAKKAGMEVIWWDPDIAAPPTDRKHGQPRDLSKVYIFLPLKERAGKR